MYKFAQLFCLTILALLLFTRPAAAQSDRGTITGTVADPAGSVIPGAAVVVTNPQTGAVYETVTTATGNYTVGQLPAAVYQVAVESEGFNRYVQQGIRVQVAQIARVDVALQIGSTTETVSVTADAPLLNTESAEVSSTISTERINELPLYGVRSDDGGLRSPYAPLRLVPGSAMFGNGANKDVRVNGMSNNSYQVRIEGQESTNAYSPQYPTGTQPGVDALEEVTIQTSNYAAEYGQVGGGLINFTSKSGSNELHGNVFEFLTNEALNAGRPFTDDGNGNLVRPRSRANVYGGSVGGPVYIPGVYDGRNKTFFFFNFEGTGASSTRGGSYSTLPTEAFRGGDFSQILTGRQLGLDPLGRPIMENAIYDPATRRLAPNGQVVTDPFPGNIIPSDRFDPVALKIQGLMPATTRAGLVNNWEPTGGSESYDSLTTLKFDQNFSDAWKMSFYWSRRMRTSGSTREGYGTDGLPIPLTTARNGELHSPTFRLNVDHVINPTTVLHLGFGWIRHLQPDVAQEEVLQYDAPGELGLVGGIPNDITRIGTLATGFPRLNGLSNGFGGVGSLGPSNSNYYYMLKPTGVVSLSHIRGNHTFKFGVEWRKEAFTDRNARGAQGIYSFSNEETSLPSTNGQNLSGGDVGFPYASFLLGAVNNASVNPPQDPQFLKTAWGVYAQDNWKIRRDITIDYGLRWDYQTALRELHNRMGAFGPDTPNPAADNLPGGTIYPGEGSGRTGGQLAKSYPFAFGPRLGLAWQVTPKTVIRLGSGLTYAQTGSYSWISNSPSVGVGWNQQVYTSPSFGEPAVYLRNGLEHTPEQLYSVTLDPGVRPAPGELSSPAYWIDPNGGRPSRIIQWSIGVQHQITTNLSAEVAYVGNRSVWNQAAGMNDLNGLTAERIASAGLDINNADDRTLLTSRMDSPLAMSRGFTSQVPYGSFPLSATVAQSLRPYPFYNNINVRWSPLGSGWYDSLQAKLTKRYSNGLSIQSAFTWQHDTSIGEDPGNDVYDRESQKGMSPYSVPLILSIAASYESPAVGSSRWTRALTGGWNFGTVLRYQSGIPIEAPSAQNALSSVLFRGARAERVEGEPLFTKDLNCHCFDPNQEFVLNPAAWADPPPGQFGTTPAYFDDYRYQRRPEEEISLGREFRIREGISMRFRAMFYNVFNRTAVNDPESGNAKATQRMDSAGQTTAGFGRINTGSTYDNPRTGRLELRFIF